MRGAPLRLLVNPAMGLLAVMLGVNVVAFATWTLPRWGARVGIVDAPITVASLRERLEPEIVAVRETYGRLRDADADLNEFRDHLVSGAGGSDLLRTLADAGRRVGLNIDDASMQLAELSELGVVQAVVTLPLAGSYREVRMLLDELAELPTFLVVEGITMQLPQDGNAPGEVRADLAISVFLEDPELVLASPARSTPPRAPTGEQNALIAALRGGDIDDIADALEQLLASLPPLPVPSEALQIRLDRLGLAAAAAAPTRDLFAVVLPPPPPMPEYEEPEPIIVEVEPVLPVRLVGIVGIDGRWRASLRDDATADQFLARAGDTLPNGVEVVEIGADYVEVIFEGERSRLSLPGDAP